ncbi:MAG: hypothetical protein WA888_09815 [Burkholderiaceae bacterium]
MTRLFISIIAAGLLAVGPGFAKEAPKTNADLEKEMAADLHERTKDPESPEAKRLEQIRRAGLQKE